ncbi:hypothetical protein HRG_001359 [Hirsutella rhossiliensis]|uniref:Cation-transporting P-type ATPase N-terminal domain-containing protein n=1 Tax=Hirsutella rhossiliensis TaxID=111463 RepID=A0A9P8N838_9HYPO|nr:uncharacterized protein HRG_01359 [Hirsutella rhossiliensis]KAH0968717.1 hypothetical protein HRG_01359 [Hirsutella rhossiliensis]
MPYPGVPIEYRTLSIYVSESRNVDAPADPKDAAKNEDCFANLDFHEPGVDTICQQLNVAQDRGLSESAAALRMSRDGPNTLPKPKTNYWKKMLFYVFSHLTFPP